MSFNEFLQLTSEFKQIKDILFNCEEQIIFESLEFYPLTELLKDLNLRTVPTNEELNIIIDKIGLSESDSSKKLLMYYLKIKH
jgi:hypothetical protein